MNIWTLIYRTAWIVLGILGLILIVSIFVPQFRQYKELERKEAVLEESLREEEELIQLLKTRQERLENDPHFLERVVREEFGMAREGETVIKFIEEKAETSPGAP